MRGFKNFVMTVGLVPVLAAAQNPVGPQWPLDTGSRIRILSPVFGSRTGIVVSTTADTLRFRPVRDGTAMAIAAPNIAKLEVSRGTHGFGVGKGLLVGLLVGATAGAILGASRYSTSDCTEICIFDRGASTALGAGLLGIGGALVGIIAGAVQHDDWVSVAIPGR